MTNRELVSRFLDCMDKQQISQENDISAIVPILLADLAYSSFNSVIKDASLIHECKSIRNEWKDGNDKFFHRFFHNTDQELENEIIDKMCDFEDYTKSLAEIVQYKVMDAVMDVPMNHQRVIAAAQFCNILSQEAQFMWGRMFKDPVYKRKRVKIKGTIYDVKEIVGWKASTNRYFEDVRKWSKKFSNKYYKKVGGNLNVKLGTKEELTKSIEALENRIVLWIYGERKCTS